MWYESEPKLDREWFNVYDIISVIKHDGNVYL